MRVGIVRTTPWWAGGGFQYELLLLDALAELARRNRAAAGEPDELIYLTDPDPQLYNLAATGAMSYGGLPVRTISTPRHNPPPPERFLDQPPPPAPPADWQAIEVDKARAGALRRLSIDWLFQLSQSPFAFSVQMPFVMPIHDLQHRLQPEFPEVSQHGQIPIREYMYRNACRHALLVLVDSEQGREDVLRFYGDLIKPERIRVLPFFPPPRPSAMPDAAELRRIAEHYRLPPRFFFYPAQFWRHKNHHLIVQALHLLRARHGEAMPVVLCGSYADRVRAENFIDLMASAERLGVRDLIHYLGWVPDDAVPALYRLSAGLVMPTFFGPTNLPALEAWHYGRPVITSDLPGLREQTGEGGLLVDPRSPEQLAEAMHRLWHDEALAAALVAHGQARLAAYRWEDFVEAVEGIVVEAGGRLRAGLGPRY